MQTILIIGVDHSLRDTVALMLKNEGFRTVTAAEGRSGFEQALTVRPDLVVVELRLTGMSGIEIGKQLNASKAPAPVIVLSALADEIDKVLLLEIGADDYVVRPFGAREVVARSRAVLRRRYGRRACLEVLQIDVRQRQWHGLEFEANYPWSQPLGIPPAGWIQT
jgi:DNA-binding response OmpR family regulator